MRSTANCTLVTRLPIFSAAGEFNVLELYANTVSSHEQGPMAATVWYGIGNPSFQGNCRSTIQLVLSAWTTGFNPLPQPFTY